MDISGDEALADALPATSIVQTDQGPFQVTHGLPVVGVDGEQVGVLTEVRPRDLLGDRPWQRDVYSPFDYRTEVRGEALVAALGGPHPPLPGGAIGQGEPRASVCATAQTCRTGAWGSCSRRCPT